MRIGSVVLAFAGASLPAGRVAPALAAAPMCDGVRVHSAPDLAPEWADAIRLLRMQLPPLAESACAAVTLSVEPAPDRGARLAAMAADGRYAERTILRPSDLAATALGLVASIPREPPGESDAGASDRQSAPHGAKAVPSAPQPSVTPTQVTAPSPQHVELWLGMSVGDRVGGPTPVEMLDFEARLDAVVTRWLLTLSLRYAPSLEVFDDDFLYEEIVIGVGAGRRIPLGRGALDLSVLPALATMNLQWHDDDANPQSGGSSTLRLGLSARWSTPVNDFWRFTITSDMDVAPSGLEHPAHLGTGAPALPVWTAGLRLGASGALL